MCISNRLSDKKLAQYKAQGKKRGYIRVWKVVDYRGSQYFPEFQNSDIPFRVGLNKAQGTIGCENTFIHAFRDRRSAVHWRSIFQVVLSCLVKPSWIIAIGIHHFISSNTGEEKALNILTTSAIVMPRFPNTYVIVKKFREVVGDK